MHIDLKLGLSCNNRCLHCIMEPVRLGLTRERGTVDSSRESIELLISSFARDGVDSITLTGGEPTLRKDFFDILRKLALSSLAVTVQSNGRLLAAEKAARHLAALPRRDILFVIALHGGRAGLHDAITRVEGSFEETRAAIQKLAALGFPMCGKMVLSRGNVLEVAPTLELMAALGMREAVVAFPHAEEFSPDALREVAPRYTEVKAALQDVAGRRTGFPNRVFWETMPFCQLPGPDFFVDSVDIEFLKARLHGSRTTIEMTMTGQRIDWEESRKSIKAKGPRCRLCLLEHVCEGVWEEYMGLYGADEFMPITDPLVVREFLESL